MDIHNIDWSAIPWKKIREGVEQKAFSGDTATLALHRLMPGHEPKPHSHPNEQIVYIMAGTIKFHIGDEEKNAGSGRPAGRPAQCASLGRGARRRAGAEPRCLHAAAARVRVSATQGADFTVLRTDSLALRADPLALRADLVSAYHVLDHDGQGSGLGGHVTARESQAGSFYCHAFGLAFDEVTDTDLLHLDFSLERLSGRGRINPTLLIHSRIYEARPEVHCIVHTHASHVVALSATGARLAMLTQLSSILQDDLSYLDEYEGIVTGEAEGDVLARALGPHRALVLKNHGLISVGRTIGEAVIGAVVIEDCAAVQLKAMATNASLSALPDSAARAAKQFLTTDQNTLDRWQMLKRRAQTQRRSA